MDKIKITSKLIISCIILSLFCLFSFEMAYNHILYKDYEEVYNKILELENRVDRVMNTSITLQKYILQQYNK